MVSVQEIEKAIQCLSPEDMSVFRKWFAEYDSAQWDMEIESDLKQGLLDELIEEARSDSKSGRTTDR